MNIKIGDVLKHKKENYYNIKILDIFTNSFIVSMLDNNKEIRTTIESKNHIKENYIIPEERWVPEDGEIYYYSCISKPELFSSAVYLSEDMQDNHRLNNNLIFRTEEEAIARSKEILELIK